MKKNLNLLPYFLFFSFLINILIFGILQLKQDPPIKKIGKFEISFVQTGLKQNQISSKSRKTKAKTPQKREKYVSPRQVINSSIENKKNSYLYNRDYLKRVSTVSVAKESDIVKSKIKEIETRKPDKPTLNKKGFKRNSVKKLHLSDKNKYTVNGNKKLDKHQFLKKHQGVSTQYQAVASTGDISTREKINPSVTKKSNYRARSREITQKGVRDSKVNANTSNTTNSSKFFSIVGEISKRRLLYKPHLPKVVSELNHKVVLRFDVTPFGKVEQVYTVKKDDPKLEKVAIQYLSKFRFEPISSGKGNQQGRITIYFQRKA